MATDLGTLLIRVGVRGVQDVTDQLKKVGDTAKESSKGIGILDIALGTLAGNLAGKAVGGLMRMPGMLFNAGAAAVNLSNQFEGIKVGLEAITGSAEQAEEKLDFIKRLAIPSEYTVSQIAEAGMMIEGMGLRLNRVLPLITQLTMGTRQTGEEYQRMAVGIFARLKEGILPGPEQLVPFGLSEAALSQFAENVGPDGKIVREAKNMLDALERLITTRFGQTLELAANTGQAKMSALADVLEQTVARLGDALKRMVMPVVDALSGWLRYLKDSNWIDQFAERLGAAFHIAGNAVTSPIDYMVSHVLALAEHLPDILKTAAETFSDIMDRVFGKWEDLSKVISGGTLGLRIDRAIQEMLPSYMFGVDAPEPLKSLIGAIPGIGLFAGARSKREVLAGFDEEIKRREAAGATSPVLTAITEALMPGTKRPDYTKLIDNRAATLMEGMSKARTRYEQEGAVLPTDTQPDQGWGKLAAPIADTAAATRATAKHTREMADAFRDLRGTMFGGGQRTRGAVSSIEAQIALARALGMGIG